MTPGPWEWVGSTLEGPRGFGDVLSCSVFEGEPPTDADARLIAAAPDLLAALKELLRAHTEAAGLTMSMVADKEQFRRFMDACETQVESAKVAASAAIAKAEAA